jgi:phosphoenolpyruvate-protein kinase (PTS system EI component)/1-acyl-sn-glycerol-3-phosphate acyltransferase
LNEVHAEEVDAVRKAKGLISVRGGKSSHSAVIAANSDVACVVNDKALINLDNRTVKIGARALKEGDTITIDGTKGTIFPGAIPLIDPTKSPAYARLMEWAEQHRRPDFKVYANADTPEEAVRAFQRGASGVGLVRSEHMFFQPERLQTFRAAILGKPNQVKRALVDIEEMQLQDYRALLDSANGRKVAVRLLDPPLHEFLPTDPKQIKEVAGALGLSVEEIMKRIDDAHEVDSLMGLRGVRLQFMRPDIVETQITALARAFVELKNEGMDPGSISITVPMVNTGVEMEKAAAQIRAVVDRVSKQNHNMPIPLKIGAMIETPAAALEAGEIAKHCDYFSYGTNDLTQLTLGFGRNVAQKFIPALIKSGALQGDPTSRLDPENVGKMLEVSEALGRDESGHLETGVCGAQGSDPESVRLIERLGIDYVSVPPGQVPQALLASAQAALLEKVGAASPEPNAMMAAAAQKLAVLDRAFRACTKIPVAAERSHLVERLDYLLRDVRPFLADVRSTSDAKLVRQLLPLFDLFAKARVARDMSRMAAAITGEIPQLRQLASQIYGPGDGPAKVRIEAALTRATSEVDLLSKLVEKRLQSERLGSAEERGIASHAWAALRALEEARTEMGEAVLPGALSHLTRLRHRNDGWDNPHYTRANPDPNEPMGRYLKRVSAEFMKDNGFMSTLVGEENIPKDRPVIFAVAHRSGAVDRFIMMHTLPIDEDKFQYIVREGSPLDRAAKASYGPDNKWIIPVGDNSTLDEIARRVDEGFKAGAKALITYPEGTGTITGEPRHVAMGAVLQAMRAGAVICPVVTQDDFRLTPFSEENVTVRIRPPIDPELVRRQLGEGASERDVADTAHAMLQFDLGAEYRSML